MTSVQIPCLHLADVEIPREFSKLYDLAYNLWWTWFPDARQLFSRIDNQSWSRYRNPVQMLLGVDPARWDSLLNDEDFRASYAAVIADFEGYIGSDQTWFQRHHPEQSTRPIAYFSMEYGVHHSLAIYSGGLGVLSGDHCKSASDLGLPFVAVGLLYRHGYFQQTVDVDGLQQHTYPEYDFSRLPLRPAAGPTGRPVMVEVPLLDRTVHAQVWVAQVGRVPLVLLDTDVRQNDPADRPISDILYVQGREMRLVQEMILGVGGVRALRALGIEPQAWHLNEGHCAFLQLERLREVIAEQGLDFAGARQQIQRNSVFTTHTPVPAGNEQFDDTLAHTYLEPWATPLGTDVETLLGLGHAEHGHPHQPLNLTALAVRTTSFTNGVSQLNAEVVNEMWQHLFDEPDTMGGPVVGITNGIHSPTWLGREMRLLIERHLGADWQELLLDPEAWVKVLDIPDEELWTAHQAQKERLGRFTRSRLREQFARHGHSPSALRAVAELFDPDVLTIAFARRFATYKRANLLFNDLVRLRKLVSNPQRPLQILFAGKAHPADRPGQELIQHIFKLSQTQDLLGKVFFIENYDMRIAGMLVQGADVWLNTPRRPLEASGTSGQKAAINGALNFSILDGWWPEGYDHENGWVIGSPKHYSDEVQQDHEDADSFYRILEEEIVPTYYQRNERGLPPLWLAHMKRAIATITPQFSSSRMVADYVRQSYLPALERAAAAVPVG